MLRKALLAVNRPALCRLEGDLGLLPAVRACDLGHLTRATVVSATPFSITQYFHSYSVCMLRTPRGILRTLPSQGLFSLLNSFTYRLLETGKTNRVARASALLYCTFFHHKSSQDIQLTARARSGSTCKEFVKAASCLRARSCCYVQSARTSDLGHSLCSISMMPICWSNNNSMGISSSI